MCVQIIYVQIIVFIDKIFYIVTATLENMFCCFRKRPEDVVILQILICYLINRSSPPEVFLGKDDPKICCSFTGEHPCRSVISVKLLLDMGVLQ